MTPEQREDQKLTALHAILKNSQYAVQLLARLLLLMEAATGFSPSPKSRPRHPANITLPDTLDPDKFRTCGKCGRTEDPDNLPIIVFAEDDLCQECAEHANDPPRSHRTG